MNVASRITRVSKGHPQACPSRHERRNESFQTDSQVDSSLYDSQTLADYAIMNTVVQLGAWVLNLLGLTGRQKFVEFAYFLISSV